MTAAPAPVAPGPIPRPAGVTASAVVALIASVFTLLLAGLMLFAAFKAPSTTEVPLSRGLAFGGALIIAAFGAFGVATAVGLFRLRQWARISILVFAGIAAAGCLMTVLVLLVVPIPPTPGANITTGQLRAIVIATYAVPILIAAWWLVQFNRPVTKQAFVGAAPSAPSARPLSISVIGWWLLIGGILTLVPVIVGMPAFIAGVILTGSSARVAYAVYAAVSVYLGFGLLKLRERARVLTMAYIGLGAAQVAYVMLSPRARERLREVQTLFDSDLSGQESLAVPLDMTTFTLGIMWVSALVLAAGLWFLVRNKPAFQRPTA